MTYVRKENGPLRFHTAEQLKFVLYMNSHLLPKKYCFWKLPYKFFDFGRF